MTWHGNMFAGPLLKFCNCAGCGCELLGWSLRMWHEGLTKKRLAELALPPVAQRVADENGHWRPYCPTCLPHVLEAAGKI